MKYINNERGHMIDDIFFLLKLEERVFVQQAKKNYFGNVELFYCYF